MTSARQIYRCSVCGNIVEVLHSAAGTLVCCGQPMELLTENTVDASKEKHIPVITKIEGGFKVVVGSALHPMEEKHYIEWIELIAGEQVLRRFLSPGQMPEAEFCTQASSVVARAYCNLHGHWKSQ
jgi:superoxide reductase